MRYSRTSFRSLVDVQPFRGLPMGLGRFRFEPAPLSRTLAFLLLYAGGGNDGLAAAEAVEEGRIEGLKLGCPRLDQSMVVRSYLRESRKRGRSQGQKVLSVVIRNGSVDLNHWHGSPRG